MPYNCAANCNCQSASVLWSLGTSRLKQLFLGRVAKSRAACKSHPAFVIVVIIVLVVFLSLSWTDPPLFLNMHGATFDPDKRPYFMQFDKMLLWSRMATVILQHCLQNCHFWGRKKCVEMISLGRAFWQAEQRIRVTLSMLFLLLSSSWTEPDPQLYTQPKRGRVALALVQRPCYFRHAFPNLIPCIRYCQYKSWPHKTSGPFT